MTWRRTSQALFIALVALLGGCWSPVPAPAQGLNPCPGVNLPVANKGFQQIAATGSAQKLTIPFATLYATINVEGAASTNIRYREDGTAPTASIGTLVPALTTTASNVPPVYITICQNELALFQFIAVAGSPILNVHYYGR
jgi:hypothetical protein